MLEEVFTILVSKYTKDQDRVKNMWKEIKTFHAKKNRYYHTLAHLENLYQQLSNIKERIKDWDMVLFALFYHDFIYNPLKINNEEKSAEKCAAVLQLLNVAPERIALCKQMVLATKGHHISQNQDVNYFTDADLSILGADWEIYEQYFKNVRKEYKYYPDFAYNKGRINVLNSFLQMPRIFKTDHFYYNYENKAQENLLREVRILQK